MIEWVSPEGAFDLFGRLCFIFAACTVRGDGGDVIDGLANRVPPSKLHQSKFSPALFSHSLFPHKKSSAREESDGWCLCFSCFCGILNILL